MLLSKGKEVTKVPYFSSRERERERERETRGRVGEDPWNEVASFTEKLTQSP